MMDPIFLEEASSSTAHGAGGGGGGRAIDRHNPIIRDEKRLGQGLVFPSSSTITITSNTTPDQPHDHHHHQKKKNSKETTEKNLKPEAETGDQKRKSIAFSGDDFIKPGDFISPETSSRYLLSDKAMFDFKSEFDYVPAQPPSRLLPALPEPFSSHNGKALKKKDDDRVSYAPPKLTPSLPPPPSPPPTPPEPLRFQYGKAFKKKDDELLSFSPPEPQPPPSPPPREPLMFLNGTAFKKKDDDSPSSSPPKPPPPQPLPPYEPLKFHHSEAFKKKDEDSLSSAPPKPPSPLPSPSSSDQVVVLEVSLHCRGCERKMRKHISKIEGVKSFKIEFEAKKVTVVGDVTPLAVLTSVLKVKNAKLLTPATISSSPAHSPQDSNFSEIKKQLGVVKRND